MQLRMRSLRVHYQLWLMSINCCTKETQSKLELNESNEKKNSLAFCSFEKVHTLAQKPCVLISRAYSSIEQKKLSLAINRSERDGKCNYMNGKKMNTTESTPQNLTRVLHIS